MDKELVRNEIERYRVSIVVIGQMLEDLADRIEDGVQRVCPDVLRGLAVLLGILAEEMKRFLLQGYEALPGEA